jgi:hypothetical protein
MFEPFHRSNKLANKNKKPEANQEVEKADAKPRRMRQEEPQQASQEFATGTSTREIETFLSHYCEGFMPTSNTGELIVNRPPAVIHVHPSITTTAAIAVIASVPPASAPATTADSMVSQRLMNFYWDDLLALPLVTSPEIDE